MSHFIVCFIIAGRGSKATRESGAATSVKVRGISCQGLIKVRTWREKPEKGGLRDGGRESFAMNISSKTRPNSRRALSLASASSLGTSQTKDPQKQRSIIIIRKWKQKCVTNQDFRASNKNYNYRLTFTNYYVDFPWGKFQWISITYFLGLKPGSFLQLRAISATPGHTQC